MIILELKCSKSLSSEHQAQVINYLAAADLPIESNLESVNEIEHCFQRQKVGAENFTNQW